MSNKIVFAFTLFMAAFAQAKTPYTFAIPSGWFENKDFMGMDYVLFTPYKPNRLQPVLFIQSQKAKAPANGVEFLQNQIKTTALGKVLESGTIPTLKSKAAFIKIQKQSGDEIVKQLFVLLPNTNSHQMLVFSAPADYFEDYYPDVKQMVKSFAAK